MKRAAALVCAAVASTVYLLTPAQTAQTAQDEGPVRLGHPAQAERRAQSARSAQPERPAQAGRSAPPRRPARPALPAAGARAGVPGLAAPAQKELAQQIVASAENGTLNWRSAYGYVEDIGDGQGYTAGLIGFCTGTHDLLALVERLHRAHPDNALARYLPALRRVDGSDSHEGLDPGFPDAWRPSPGCPRSGRRRTRSATASTSTRRCVGAGPTGWARWASSSTTTRSSSTARARPDQLRRHPRAARCARPAPRPGRRRGRYLARSSTRAAAPC